ncbi:MAG: hypothetical protein D6815_13000, partial [Candidatus Dadabacteria bacterium]
FLLACILSGRARLDGRRLGLLLVALVVASSALAPVALTYAEGQSEWRLFWRRPASLLRFADLWPGGSAGVGIVPLCLALAGALAPRVPLRAPLLAGTLACLLVCAGGRPWPGGPKLPAIYSLLAARLEFLSYVRAPAALSAGVVLGLSLLAAAGANWVIEAAGRRGGSKAARAAAAVLLGAAALEIFWPPLATLGYGRALRPVVKRLAPPAGELSAYAGSRGPVLDLPFDDDARRGMLREMPHYVLLAAYHGRPAAACYNSYKPATAQNAARIARRLAREPERGLLEAAAAGYTTLVLHRDMPGAERYAHLFEGKALAARRLEQPPADTASDPSLLAAESFEVPPLVRPRVSAWFGRIRVASRSELPWVAPRPPRPLGAYVRFLPAGRGQARSSERALMLPLALAPGGRDEIPVPLVPLPPPGRYTVEVEVPELGWLLRSAFPLIVQGGTPSRLRFPGRAP